jgi:pimeloyl-ACP methyl ester carboxylesterase
MISQLKYDSSSISYKVVGKGKPVILLHGFGEDGSIWDKQTNDLSNYYKVIVPDLPGSGQSGLITDMSIEGMAEVIHEIIHAEEITACPVIGHSMGGYITLALAEKYYNHVSAFGLFHSTAFADSEEKKESRRKAIGFIQEHGAAAFLKTSIPNLFSAKSKDEQPCLIDELLTHAHNFLPAALVSYYSAMINRPDRTTVLKNTNAPVLFVAGPYDNAVPMADMLQQCHLPEKAYIHILQNSGHMGMLEEAELSTKILLEFLQETGI